MSPRFHGNFTQQLPIPEEGIERAVAVMRSGSLHRYNVVDGEAPETVRLENEFAAYMGARFCLACTSGGYALQTALRAFGVSPGEPVLTNGFTLSPVPGAIAAASGKAVLVEVTEDLVIDIDDLARKAATSEARVLMLSHMRGWRSWTSLSRRGMCATGPSKRCCAQRPACTFPGALNRRRSSAAPYSSWSPAWTKPASWSL